MAPAYNTIPAAAEEQDSLLAPKNHSSKLKGLVAGAALASLVLGVVAATALKMPAGTAQTMLSGPDPLCNGKTAPAYSSGLSEKLNKAMGGDGFIWRYRYDMQIPCHETYYKKECGEINCKGNTCGVAATLLSNKAHTENPVYCIQNDHGCDSPSVGYAVLDHWSLKGGELKGYASVRKLIRPG